MKNTYLLKSLSLTLSVSLNSVHLAVSTSSVTPAIRIAPSPNRAKAPPTGVDRLKYRIATPPRPIMDATTVAELATR